MARIINKWRVNRAEDSDMADEFKLPDARGAVFWPVGTGDSTTFVLRPGKVVMQVDLRHLEKADDPDEPEWAVIDQLVKVLPKRNGRPYLRSSLSRIPTGTTSRVSRS
jgi:hypothetical protein